MCVLYRQAHRPRGLHCYGRYGFHGWSYTETHGFAIDVVKRTDGEAYLTFDEVDVAWCNVHVHSLNPELYGTLKTKDHRSAEKL